MKRSKVKKSETEADMLITGDELHELDRVCAGLVDATEHAWKANEMIAPDIPDIKARPVPPLQSLPAGETQLGQLLESMRTSLKAAWRGDNAELRARLLAHWLHFAYTGAVPLLQKKSRLALAIGKRDAATNFEKAFDAIPPRNKTDIPNGWRGIEREASRIAATTTPDTFYFDVRRAFMLDAEATAEINGEGESTDNGGADSVSDSLKRIEAGQSALLDGQSEQNTFNIGLGRTVNEIARNTRPDTPRPHDREVTQPDAAQILTDAGYKVSARQVQNWDRFIKTNGAKGTRPPDGYRIELRAQFPTFKAWAENAAKGKRMKTALRQRRQKAHKTNA